MNSETKKPDVLIIDDENLAREILISYLDKSGMVNIAGECSNGFEALKMIQELKPDLIFLDVQMPKITGFELLEVLENPPMVIFITAYEQYAIKAFENNAVDYILKPFSYERLCQSLTKAIGKLNQTADYKNSIENFRNQMENEEKNLDRIVVRKGSGMNVIPVSEIFFIEAQDDYSMIITQKGRFMKDRPLKFFESKLGKEFVRVHRSYIININQLDSIEPFGKESYHLKLKCGQSVKASAAGYKLIKSVVS